MAFVTDRLNKMLNNTFVPHVIRRVDNIISPFITKRKIVPVQYLHIGHDYYGGEPLIDYDDSGAEISKKSKFQVMKEPVLRIGGDLNYSDDDGVDEEDDEEVDDTRT
jgi:hypothetical protein